MNKIIPCETCISFAICKAKAFNGEYVYIKQLFDKCSILREITYKYGQINSNAEFLSNLCTYTDLYKKAFRLFIGNNENYLNKIIMSNRNHI